jgi:hypothetical protein
MLLRISSVVVLLAMLFGCSRTALLYDNADWMAMRWTASLLDADAEQEAAWRQLFDEVAARHRTERLPEVIGLLNAFENQAESGIRQPAFDCWLESVDAAYRSHAALIVPVAATVLGDIRPEQIDHLERELAERVDESREERLFADPVEQFEARVERYIERIERWTGNLEDSQSQLVKQVVAGLPDISGTWLDYRQSRHEQLLSLLRAAASDEQLRSYLQAWWVTLDDRPAALTAGMNGLREGMLELMTRLDSSLTSRQRETLLENIQDIRLGLESVDAAAAALAREYRTLGPCAKPRPS